MTDRGVGLAIIGVGRMGAFHARCLAPSEAVSVLAVADADEVALRSIASEIEGVSTYTDPAGALEHAGVEACLIATPTPLHPKQVRDALEAGIHVLCEKPLALDTGEARALGALADRVGRVLQVGFWRRFSPPWQRAKELVDSGRIGRPRLVRLAQWDADPPPPAFCDPAVSGGLAVDCGVHEFDLAEWLTGQDIVRVRAWSLPLVDEGLAAVGDVDNLVAVLELADGSVATVDLSRNCRYGDDVRTEILGSDGAVFIDILPEGRARLATAEGVEQLGGSQTDDATAEGVLRQAEVFAAAVRGAEVEIPGALESARATEVGQAVQRAAATGEAMEIMTMPGAT